MIIKTALFGCFFAMLFGATTTQAQLIQGRVLHTGINTSKPVPAKGVKVILFPRNPTTEKISDNFFFYGDDKIQLQKLNAIVTSTNDAGIYYFSKVKEGRYIVKVCVAYGMTYKFKVVSSQYKVLNIKDLPAAFNSK
ncbi:hypothetical protein [Lacibacter luteus]|nr:hypothetical protein [Lacibacter luteus]